MNRTILLLCLTALTVPVHAAPLDWQIHGFVSQGFVLTGGNRFFGDKGDHSFGDSKDGSLEFYEAGINGSIDLGAGFTMAAQGVIRDAGNLDPGKPRLDFGQLDYRFVRQTDLDMGVRLGRVKNPIGLYNDTRDLVFTRPGILLPQSVYFEGIGLRSLLFSSDGGQFYGRWSVDNHDLSWTLSRAQESDLSNEELEQLSGGGGLPPGDVHLDQFYLSQLRDDWSSGRVTVALTHVHARLALQDSPLPIELAAKVNLFVLSGRYNAEKWSATAEYIQTRTSSTDSFNGRSKSINDGFYVQGDYRFTPAWSAFARYDASFSNIHDRDGSELPDDPINPRPKSSGYAHDFALGVNWRHGEHWGVWAEGHVINGTATVPALDNPREPGDPPYDSHWQLFTLMVSYRF
jgi:hypothetical protein